MKYFTLSSFNRSNHIRFLTFRRIFFLFRQKKNLQTVFKRIHAFSKIIFRMKIAVKWKMNFAYFWKILRWVVIIFSEKKRGSFPCRINQQKIICFRRKYEIRKLFTSSLARFIFSAITYSCVMIHYPIVKRSFLFINWHELFLHLLMPSVKKVK